MPERFKLVDSFGGLKLIKDSKDGTLVATIHGVGREKEKTEAMQRVILNALNEAVRSPQVTYTGTGPDAA